MRLLAFNQAQGLPCSSCGAGLISLELRTTDGQRAGRSAVAAGLSSPRRPSRPTPTGSPVSLAPAGLDHGAAAEPEPAVCKGREGGAVSACHCVDRLSSCAWPAAAAAGLLPSCCHSYQPKLPGPDCSCKHQLHTYRSCKPSNHIASPLDPRLLQQGAGQARAGPPKARGQGGRAPGHLLVKRRTSSTSSSALCQSSAGDCVTSGRRPLYNSSRGWAALRPVAHPLSRLILPPSCLLYSRTTLHSSLQSP